MGGVPQLLLRGGVDTRRAVLRPMQKSLGTNAVLFCQFCYSNVYSVCMGMTTCVGIM